MAGMNEEGTQQSRRMSDAELISFHGEFKEHAKNFTAHRTEFLDLSRKVDTFMDVTFPEHSEEEKKRLGMAFPKDSAGNLDLEGHRRAHEAMISAARAQEKFWNELRLEIAKKGAIALIVTVLGLLAVGLSQKLGIGPTP